ncbi:hypothetical protein BD413DRAFT_662612 [Trametes elegans]|nr:hypothetical protein BD413DRAFT_662612 [Trametes elegans]
MLRWTLQTVRVVCGCALRVSREPLSGYPLTNTAPFGRNFSSSSAGRQRGHTSCPSGTSETLTDSSATCTDGRGSHPVKLQPMEVDAHLVGNSAASPRLPTGPHVSSMAELHAFLNVKKLRRDTPRYTVRKIRHRYMTWKTDGVLHHLSAHDMSALICLLGSLIVSVPGRPRPSSHSHRRLHDMSATASHPRWELVLGICRDKQQLGHSLFTSDLYWRMRGLIARFEENAASDRDKAERRLVEAKSCYMAIAHTSPSPDIHLPIFKALLVASSVKHSRDLAVHMAALLRRFGSVHPSLRRVFFKSIVACAEMRSHPNQEILSVVAQRLVRREDGRPVEMVRSSVTHATSSQHTSAHGLVLALEQAVFVDDLSDGTSHLLDNDATRWARTVAGRVFSATSGRDPVADVRWNCLVLLALVRTHTPEWSGSGAELSTDPALRAAIMEWQTSPGSPANSSLSTEVAQGFSGVLRNLWHEWIAVPSSVAPPRSPYVSRDRTLVDACREHSISAGLWAPGLQTLATEQLFAALSCGTFFERAIVDLVVCTADMGILKDAVGAAHAQELLAWARHRGIPTSGQVVADVGIALARHGVGIYLDRYLNDPRLSPEQLAQVTTAYLRTYAVLGPSQIARVVVSLVPQMSDPLPLLGRLRPGHAAEAVALFEPAATPQLISRLLRLAQRVLARCARVHPNLARILELAIIMRIGKAGASKITIRLALRSRLPRRSFVLASAALARAISKRRRTALPTRSIPSLYGTSSDPVMALNAIEVLVRARRFHLAKKLYARVCAQEDVAVRTDAGNIILHGAVHRRRLHRRRLRVFAYVYRTLVERHAFVPNRVTVNIVLKTLLLSRELDRAQMRALFDAVVRMGFPVGNRGVQREGEAGSRGVFGTDGPLPMAVKGVEIPRAMGPIMYARHVRPLYKTFIKAFYLVGDVRSAWVVITILKDLKARQMQRVLEDRDWVVSDGVK